LQTTHLILIFQGNYIFLLQVPFKGTVSRDFRTLVFSLNGTPGPPYSWAKVVLNIDSNSRSNSIRLFFVRLRAMLHSAKFKKKFYLRLSAMPLNVKFKSKIFLSTPRYAAQRGVESALWRTAGSRDSALRGIAQSRFSSSNLIECLREFESICKTVIAHESGGPGVQFNEKTEVENLVRLSL
jgi:hypothetical protein